METVDKRVKEELEEKGYRPPPPPINPVMPPLQGEWTVPPHLTFSGIVNQISHSYRWTFDESLKECVYNAKAMRRDPVLMGALRARQIPVAQLDFHLEAQNEKDPKQLAAVANLENILKKDFPRFQEFKMSLLEAIWFGRAGCQMTYKWDYTTGSRRLLVKDHSPINGDKLVFKWWGNPGVLVHPLYEGTKEMTDRGLTHFVTNQERQCWAIHRFEPEDSDFFDFDRAGAVMGVGVRGRLYWFWWLKTKILGQLIDYLQRVAVGYTIYYYEQGSEQSRMEVEDLAAKHIGGQAIIFPRKADGTGPMVQRLEPSTAGAQLFESLITGYFDDVMTQFIRYQTLTSGTGATGLGSGVAEAHQSTEERIISYDAISLAETMTTDVVYPLHRWNNCQNGEQIPCPKLVFDVEKPNVSEYMEGVQTYFEMGGTVDGDDVRSVLGIPRPEPNHEILAKMAPEQPATIGTPQGVPVQSPGGEAQDQGQGQGQEQDQQAAQQQGQTQQVPMNSVPPGPAVVQRQRFDSAIPMTRTRWNETMRQLARGKRRLLERRSSVGMPIRKKVVMR